MYVLLFLWGSCCASAGLGLGYQLKETQSHWMRRSRCDHCQRTLCWFHLVPIISYICLLGRCAYCRSRIDPINLLAEIAGGASMLALYHVYYSSSLCPYYLALWSCCLIMAGCDYHSYWIPTPLLVIASICCLPLVFQAPHHLFHTLLIGVYLGGYSLIRPQTIGWADVWLLMLFASLLPYFLLPHLLGGSAFLGLIMWRGLPRKEKAIPFAPCIFLCFYSLCLYQTLM